MLSGPEDCAGREHGAEREEGCCFAEKAVCGSSCVGLLSSDGGADCNSKLHGKDRPSSSTETRQDEKLPFQRKNRAETKQIL